MQCDWSDNGVRCARPGTSANRDSGRNFCQEHAQAFEAALNAGVPEPPQDKSAPDFVLTGLFGLASSEEPAANGAPE